MKKMILVAIFFWGYVIISPSRAMGSDFIMKSGYYFTALIKQVSVSDTNIILNSEDDIKAKLILLALNNSQVLAADANVRIAEIARRKANSSFLGSVNLGGNVNEFVINNSPAANFFPKYNFGLTIPLDMFAKNRAEKRTADEMIIVNTSQKVIVGDALKAKVLILYETYKEKKALLELQRIIMDEDIASYEKAQKDFKDDLMSIEDVNKLYKELLTSKADLATREKELNIAVIGIEELIGAPLKSVLEKRQN